MPTYFDRLPVELLYMIFQFMSNCDVIWSFFDVSPYLNAVLNNYNWHKLNFKSISKIHFDFICNHLNLHKIISLTLSDDLKTPGQVQLFFNRFNLQDFINLRSLTFLSITNEDIYPILFNLPKLKYLTSLITECRSSQPLLLGQILTQLKSLENLSVSHGDIFDHNVALPLRNLKVLHAGTCNFLELRRLQMIVPSLVSLKINLQANHQLQLLSDFDIWSSLERLNLTLNHETTTTFIEIQRLLFHFYNLIHLTLNIRGSADNLADGYRWETCSTIIRLRKFNFIIEFQDPFTDDSQVMNEILKSFSTSFWRDIKKWYVAITTHNVYTISCFNDQLFIIPTTSLPLSTSFDNHWYYSKTKRIKISKNISSINLNQFYNLERLDLFDENKLLLIDNINQFIHLRHLIIHQNISNKILCNILKHNSNIDHLTLSQNNFHQLIPLENIHYLHIENIIKFTNRTQIKELCRIFPCVQRLFIHVNSIRLICQIINGFHHLENGIFQFNGIIKPISNEWLKENTRLNNKTCSFTCRSEPNKFLIWISNSIVPTIHLKDNIAENFNSIQDQRSDKCSLQ
ncbi:unnamed protein product [Rotaria sordida]|uniref:F-box domain-containing protein n=2 Tax=Rotaria sordida TaxID=392033 RepID=A0A819C8N1_9BILA|nr:unnamed protein product [Rotaria sordida]